MPAELTTTSAVQIYLGITTDTSLISTLVLNAEDAIRYYCDRPLGFLAATVGASATEVFDGESWRSMVLTYTPLTSITSVTLRGSSTAMAAASYDFVPSSGVLRLLNSSTSQWGMDYAYAGRTGWGPVRFPDGFRQVTVVYVGGYSAVPPSLSMAATLLTCSLFSTRAASGPFKSETLGRYSYTKEDWSAMKEGLLPPQVAGLVQPFRRRTYL